MSVNIHFVKRSVKSYSVGSENMSHRWTSVLDDNINLRFVLFESVQQGTVVKKFRVRIDVINLFQTTFFQRERIQLRSYFGMCRTMSPEREYRPCVIQRSMIFLRTLSKHIHLIGARGSTSENAHYSSWCGLGVFKVSSKICVMKQPEPAVFCSVFHMTTLSLLTRVMHVRNQTSQASVTSSRPLRDCSCQFVHRPQNVRSADARQIKAFESTLLTILPPFPVLLTSTDNRRYKVWRLHTTVL